MPDPSVPDPSVPDLRPSRPQRVVISNRSANVRVVAEPGVGLAVVGGDIELGDDGTSTITSRSTAITVRCAPGCDVVIGTLSGSVSTTGPLGNVSVATASGRVEVEEATALDIRTNSGRVVVGTCHGPVRCNVRSGRVEIASAESVDVSVTSGRVEVADTGDARVHTTSGRVVVATRAASDVHVRSTSGRVDVTLPGGCCPALHLATTSGKVRSDVPAGDDGTVDAATVSGSVRVRWR